MSSKHQIVYVDDEINNLTVFEATFEDDYQIHTFSNPEEALIALPDLDPAVILSDQKMPQMDGVTFLTRAIVLKPDAISFIVTGYAEQDLLVNAVNKAGVFHYCVKPWDSSSLEKAISTATSVFDSRRRQQSEILLLRKEIEELKVKLKSA
jgi:DNA-binding NtrC family response regulator